MKKIKQIKKEIIRSIAQLIGNVIIIMVSNARSQEELEHWCLVGLYLDSWCIEKHNIFLK